jgi:hypothetical protein
VAADADACAAGDGGTIRVGGCVLAGGGCIGPLPLNCLELYFREKN